MASPIVPLYAGSSIASSPSANAETGNRLSTMVSASNKLIHLFIFILQPAFQSVLLIKDYSSIDNKIDYCKI